MCSVKVTIVPIDSFTEINYMLFNETYYRNINPEMPKMK